ncbi:MAG TPA: hypothetical protein DIW47_07410 [Bacteroidetes bacterium]|nr:hypothetical protein [Bacteroidota bacterium]
MKKPLLLLALLAIFCSGNLFAQSDIYLKINHKMGDSAFAFNKNTETADGEPFKFRRLEYYMSSIILIHDGGQQTAIADTWLLVKGNMPLNVLLGSHTITNLEEIRFSIGVQEAYNHLDPSTYAPAHPLAPKSPSMHWGWQAGYRFIALEGSGGTNRDQNVEVHSLGDVNYLQIKISTAGVKVGNDLTIELNADYAQALKGIETTAGVVTHAEVEEGYEMIMNFANHVFTSSEGNSSVLSNPEIAEEQAVLYPNPSSGSSTLSFKDENMPSCIQVYDQQGKCVARYDQVSEAMILAPQSPGFYVIALEYAGKETRSVKWVVTP